MEIPSITFSPFLAGARACVGLQFALIEFVPCMLDITLFETDMRHFYIVRMKNILFSLLRVIQFDLSVPADDIEPKAK